MSTSTDYTVDVDHLFMNLKEKNEKITIVICTIG